MQSPRRAATRPGDMPAYIVLPFSSRSSCTVGYWLYHAHVATVVQHLPTPGPIDSLHGELKDITHACHRLGFSNINGICYQAWQATVKAADGPLSNGLVHRSSQLTLGEVKVALKYRRGLLYNCRR